MANIAPDKTTEENSILTIRDLARLLSVSEASIYSMNYRGTGPRYLRIGKAVRYRREAVDQWLRDKESGTWHL